MVGNIGAPGKVDYTVVGDTVNVAQRLMELGRERLSPTREVAIVVSEAVARETATALRFAEIGVLAPRGREAPVHAFELLVSARPSHPPPTPVPQPSDARFSSRPCRASNR